MSVVANARRMRWVAGAVGTLVVGLAAWIALDHGKAATVSAAAGILISGTSLLLGHIAKLGSTHATPTVGERAAELSRVVEEQWLAEAFARGLGDSGVLPLEWTGRDGDGLDAAGGGAAVDGRVIRLNLTGRIEGGFSAVCDKLAASYSDLPGGRMVLLGEPGAGKTVLGLLLTIGLLKRRGPQDPVPLLISISGWDPVVDPLRVWLVRAISASYYAGRQEIAAELLRCELLLPILDGLDEIPESSRRHAMQEMNRAFDDDVPMVVTCRSNEYQDLIVDGSPTLGKAPVIEVRPVKADDLAEYFGRLRWADPGCWSAVLTTIRTEPRGALASTLSTPLYISLARSIFQRLDEGPSMLLDGTRFGTRHSIENWLTDRTVLAAYATGSSGADDWRRRARRATGHLAYIAHHMHGSRDKDLAWWKLSERLLSRWFGPVLGIAAGLILMVAIVLTSAFLDGGGISASPRSSRYAAGAGLAFAILVTVFWSSGGDRQPRRLAMKARGSAGRIGAGFAVGARAAAILVLPLILAYVLVISFGDVWSMRNIANLSEALGAALSLICASGVAAAALRWLDGPQERATAFEPRDLERHDRRASLVGALIAGVLFAAVFAPGLIGWLWVGSTAQGLLTNWAGWPGTPDLALPLHARAYDVTGRSFSSTPAAVFGLAVFPGLAFAFLVLLTRAWPRYIVSCWVIAAQGRLPWRLSTFLDDAYRRGVLRRSGETYQFKHARLQEQLALAHTARADPGRPAEDDRTVPVDDRARGWSRRVRAVAVVTVVALLTGTVVVTLPESNSRVALAGRYGKGPYAVTFSPDGGRVALRSAKDPDVRVFDASGGGLVATLRLPAGGAPSGSVFFSPDGRKVAVGYRVEGAPMQADLWNLDERSLDATVPLVDDDFNTGAPVHFSADGETVALLGPGSGPGRPAHLRIWHFGTRQYLFHLLFSAKRLPSFGPDGRTLAVYENGAVVLRRMVDATRIVTMGRVSGDWESSTGVVYSPDGTRILAGTRSRGRSMWDTDSGRLVRSFTQVSEIVNDFMGRGRIFSSDSRHLTIVDNGVVTCVDARTGRNAWPARGHGEYFFLGNMTMSADAMVMVAEDNGAIDVWNRGVLRSTALVSGNYGGSGIELLGGERYAVYVAGTDDLGEHNGHSFLVDVATAKVTLDVRGIDTDGPAALDEEAVDHSRTARFSAADGMLRFYRMADGKLTFQTPDPDQAGGRDAPDEGPRSWFADDRLIVRTGVEGDSRSFTVRDTTTGRLVRTIPDVVGVPHRFGGLVATIGSDHVIRLWRLDSWELAASLRGHTDTVDTVTLGPGGRILASSSRDGTVRLWDLPPA